MRKESILALLNNSFLLLRRMTLLFLAMFVLEMQWLQVLVFMSLNVVSLVYIFSVWPFKDKSNNYLNIFNEFVNLVCSYWITQINDLRYEPLSAYSIGEKVQYTLYFSWSCNFIFIFYLIVK